MGLTPRNEFRLDPRYQPLMRAIGLDAEAVFNHPQIVAWRKLPDRENCTLDGSFDGKPIRLHIKRYAAISAFITPADDEVKALQALHLEKIPTMTLVGWGRVTDGRSFVITEDLAGYTAADKLVEAGTTPFETLLQPTADLAARLHKSGLHHRDLYLCHFFVKLDGPNADVRLIDAARVARLGGFLTRGRWIVKDLAQFWYSTTTLPVSDEQRDRWLSGYAASRNIEPTPRLRRAIERKARAIGRHDTKLKQSQPTRNISIPTT